eukprot:6199283-Pleurochrysis_carterae.AAC.1
MTFAEKFLLIPAKAMTSIVPRRAQSPPGKLEGRSSEWIDVHVSSSDDGYCNHQWEAFRNMILRFVESK